MISNRIKQYYRPSSIKEAVVLKEKNPEAVYLSGGTEVNRAPLDRTMPPAVIDLRDAVDSEIITKDTEYIIGACTTLQTLVDAEQLPQALRDAAAFIPSRSIRNQATIGGGIAARRSDSYIIPALIALNAELCTQDERMTVHAYVDSDHSGIIQTIRIPLKNMNCVVVKESRSHHALPVVSAAVSLIGAQGRIDAACIAVGCMATKIIRLSSVENALVHGALFDHDELEAAIRDAVNPQPDILGSTAYKRYINGVIIAEAVMQCREALS